MIKVISSYFLHTGVLICLILSCGLVILLDLEFKKIHLGLKKNIVLFILHWSILLEGCFLLKSVPAFSTLFVFITLVIMFNKKIRVFY